MFQKLTPLKISMMLPNTTLAKKACSLRKLTANRQMVNVISSKYKMLEKLTNTTYSKLANKAIRQRS